jgi:hypothetical protein
VRKKPQLPLIGWREWVALPELGISAIKAKIDTGARSSSLHAFAPEFYTRKGREYVRFEIHPKQRSTSGAVEARSLILERRIVRSSSGKASERPVIITEVELLGERWPIELTLANRDEMGFRMLLGREAMRKRFLVDPGKSFFGGKPVVKKKKVKK